MPIDNGYRRKWTRDGMIVVPNSDQDSDALPPGYRKKETLRREYDDLVRRAEELASELGLGVIDVKKLDPEKNREIAYQLSSIEITNKRPGWRYAWVYRGISRDGRPMFGDRDVRAAQIRGWEIVQGDDQEAIELKGIGADTTRVLGDVILMRMPEDAYNALRQREWEIAARQSAATEGALKQMVEPFSKKYPGTKLVEMATPGDAKELGKEFAAQMAGKMVEEDLRRGTLPGVPVGKR